jgi:hypothetical protein
MLLLSRSIAIDYATPANALIIHDWSKKSWIFRWRKFNNNGMINNIGFMWELTHDYSVKNILAELYFFFFSLLTISRTRYVSAICLLFYFRRPVLVVGRKCAEILREKQINLVLGDDGSGRTWHVEGNGLRMISGIERRMRCRRGFGSALSIGYINNHEIVDRSAPIARRS